MVERVARVICAQWGERDPAFIDKRWHLQIPVAEAVIKAMRKPTPLMCEEAKNWLVADDQIANLWGGMIDAALVDRPQA